MKETELGNGKIAGFCIKYTRPPCRVIASHAARTPLLEINMATGMKTNKVSYEKHSCLTSDIAGESRRNFTSFGVLHTELCVCTVSRVAD